MVLHSFTQFLHYCLVPVVVVQGWELSEAQQKADMDKSATKATAWVSGPCWGAILLLNYFLDVASLNLQCMSQARVGVHVAPG